MTKNPRDPRKWSNREIQQDGEGYVAAQQAFREDQATAERQGQEADDERRFREEYIRNGGRERDAEAAHRTHRNQQAAEAAGRAENEALTANQRHVSRML